MSMTIANVEMAAAWDGGEGDHWTEFADRYDAASTRTWTRFLDGGPIRVDDRVLDIGCGTGQSTRDAARLASSGAAVGVDLSARMLDDARRRSAAEGLTNVEFVQADAQVHRFDAGSFDVVISRFGAMFFVDRVAAFANFASALKPGGRLAVLAWRGLEENEWLHVYRDALAVGRDLPTPPLGAPGPFGLADDDGARTMLEEVGFADVAIERIEEPMYLGADFDHAWSWVKHLGVVKGMTHDLSEADRATAIANLQDALRAHETSDGVLLGTSASLITATKP